MSDYNKIALVLGGQPVYWKTAFKFYIAHSVTWTYNSNTTPQSWDSLQSILTQKHPISAGHGVILAVPESFVSICVFGVIIRNLSPQRSQGCCLSLYVARLSP